MQEAIIKDSEIPGADPAVVVEQYDPLVKKIANRYAPILERSGAMDIEDLYQVGRLVVLKAQKQYDPDKGASFLSFVFNPVRTAMRRAMGINEHTGALPERLESLDAPLTDESEGSRIDFIPDTTPTAEERIIEEDTHQEAADAVHAAIDRLKNGKQREAITRCWLNGQGKPEAAAEMGISTSALMAVDLEGRHKLRRDLELKKYAALRYPSIRVGTGRFRSDWTSATEAAVLWRERMFDYQFGQGAFVRVGTRQDLGNVQTSTAEART